MSVSDAEERWLPVVGWEDLYLVSSRGRMRSLHKQARAKDGILAATVSATGYHMVGLCRGGARSGRTVHSLVAEAFIGPRPDGSEVCHGDGDRTNNHVENLRYGTRSENTQDTLAQGSHNHASKTHCAQGHELTADNIRRRKDRPNSRECRECNNSQNRSWSPADFSAAEGLVARREAAAILGIAPGSMHAFVRQSPDFPEQRRIRGRVFWDPEELRAWREQHPARRKR